MSTTTNPARTATVNGIELGYQVFGQGDPRQPPGSGDRVGS